MALATWFWILYVLGFLFGGWWVYRNRGYWPALLVWVLIGIIGWAQFGGPIK